MAVHELTIPGFLPARLNSLMGNRRKAGRLKRRDKEWIICHARMAGIPKATGRRRVTLILTFGKGVRSGDPDAYWKSTLDALVHAGLLAKDTHRGVSIEGPEFRRSKTIQSSTTIILEDIGC